MARIALADCPDKAGKKVEVSGWIDIRRDHGKLIFVDLRDESGIIQAVVTPKQEEAHKIAAEIRPEWVVTLRGLIKERPEGMRNKNIPTGSIELEVHEIEVLNEAETPPFEISGDAYDISEEVRLQYRYIDLRRARLQKNLRLRSDFSHKVRQYLHGEGFTEIETPNFTKSTPEGSRDFLVPSRMQPGHFYALPQSPQQYKQLLMSSGFEKYFQLARCFRDEDLRADRSFEHTQVDMEMSFVTREQIMKVVEDMYTSVCEDMGYKIKEKPFPVFTYAEAIKKHGADKFDLRENEKESGILAFAWVIDFPLFEKTDDDTWTYSHNPFTGPKPEDEEKLASGKDIEKIISQQCDLVCNGHEVGGGGIRINKAELLQKVFEIIGHSPEKVDEQFGHILTAFKHGAPPEGGMGLGLDRMVAILAGEVSLREVQAFPTTSGGRTAVMEAPSEVSDEQLEELGLQIKKTKK
ncbi:MAG: aspartate--tRNA ligase [bacterium]|nr:aspartate--tRNA ligase [bacterium]